MVVPKPLRTKIISDTHGDVMTGHESKHKTKERIISSYWWPGIDTEIEIHIKNCENAKEPGRTKEQVQLLQVHYPNAQSLIRELTWTYLDL